MSNLNLKELSLPDKKSIIALGKELVASFGKQKYYTYSEVIYANHKISPTVEIPWLGLCMYCTYEVFMEAYLKHYPEADQGRIQAEYQDALEILLEVLIDPALSQLVAFKLEMLQDVSWLDYGDFFDGLGEGIGDVFTGLIDMITSIGDI